MQDTNKVLDEKAISRRERKKLFTDAISHDVKPTRVPILSNAFMWKYLDAGYTLRECIYEYDKAFDAGCKHHEKYNADVYMDLGNRFQIRVTDCYGKSLYEINDEADAISIRDFAIMDEDDYDTFIEDGPLKFFFERAVPARYGITDREDMIKKYGEASREYDKMQVFNKRIQDQYVEGFGVPMLCQGRVNTAIEYMMGALRGMRNLSMDMRRRPDKLEAAMNKITEFLEPSFEKSLESYDPESDRYVMFARITSLAHNMLNPKQFERFSWPQYKSFVDKVSAHGLQGFLFYEGSVDHIIDYLREIPEGQFALLMETGDPVEIKKKLPNLTIVGGYPVSMLQNGSVQDNIDKAKEFIDSMAYDGNYIFSTDKMMCFRNDGKSENFKAVIDFVREYGVY